MANIARTESPGRAGSAWKILVVDDEPAIHQVTRLALRNMVVLGSPVQLINALSGQEAREEITKHPDIAVVLLDVVMETEDAGLQFIRFLREEKGNALTRIILRTGQPGQAPERQVMIDYDINDYKEKTELTAAKLFTSVMSSVRTYGHLRAVQKCHGAMEVLGQLNSHLFGCRDEAALAHCLASQCMALDMFTTAACWTAQTTDAPAALLGDASAVPALQALVAQALGSPGQLLTTETHSAVVLPMAQGRTLALGVSTAEALPAQWQRLLELVVRSAAVAVAHWSAPH